MGNICYDPTQGKLDQIMAYELIKTVKDKEQID